MIFDVVSSTSFSVVCVISVVLIVIKSIERVVVSLVVNSILLVMVVVVDVSEFELHSYSGHGQPSGHFDFQVSSTFS